MTARELAVTATGPAVPLSVKVLCLCSARTCMEVRSGASYIVRDRMHQRQAARTHEQVHVCG